MPSSSNVDERVVQMRMDNEQFEKGAERTIGTLEKLKKSMNFEDTKVNADFSPLERSVEKIGDKISMTFSAKKRVIENMIDGVVNTFKRAVNDLDNISPGYQKYESQIEAVQKLMIATGESMDNVQKMSDKILAFTDETSYEYTAMLDTLSQFSTAGVGLEDAQNTIIGLAVAAGQAGVSSEKASHAFMGFQKAMSQGYMGSNQWDWIKTAGMNTLELQQALINAAVAEGKLRDAGNGVYYASQQTAKGVKEIEVTVENMGNTFASKWLTREAMIKGASDYAKAFNQIYDIADRENLAIWQVIDDASPYLNQLDQYSLAAFKAGQETKTWSDAVKALKSTISSGWMKSFELVIGNYEQASGFFTDIIEPLYTLFTSSGTKRNTFLEAAFGTSNEAESTGKSVLEAAADWDRLSKKLEETEHTTDELEDAFKKVAESDDKVKALTKEYGSLEEAIKDGAVSGELLKQILNEINGVTTETSEAVADTAKSYQQYLETAWAVLRGDYGNGDERRKALEELGMDYDMIQWLAGNLANGMTMDTMTLDWIAQVAPNHYEEFIKILGQTEAAAAAAGDEFIDLADVVQEAAVVAETAGLSGREIWQNSVTNILGSVADIATAIGDAFDDVFGDAETRGKGLRGWLNRIYEATKHFEISEGIIQSIQNTAKNFFTTIKTYGVPALDFLKDLAKSGFKNLGKAFSVFKKTGKFVTGIFGDLFEWGKKMFSGKLDLTENLKNSDSALGKIGETASNIINSVTEFMKGFNPWDALNHVLDKLEEIREKLKGGQGLGSVIKDTLGDIFHIGEDSEPTGILGFFSRLFGGFSKDSEDLSGSLLTIEEGVGGLSDTVRGLSGAMTDIHDVLSPFTNLIFGDKNELEQKAGSFWDRVKKLFVTEYGKINWDTLLDLGKFGLFGLLISKTNSFFNALTGTLKKGNTKVGTIRGLIASLQGLADSVKAPFNAMSKAITNHEKADRYLKIAAAIGILAWSINKLAAVDEQKFFNVAVTLGFLMMIMAQMAKNMDGFQLFSNNVKTISKNNQSSSHVLESLGKSLKNFLSLDLSNFQGKLKINVFSSVAQTLIGAAVLLTAVVFAIMKLKDAVQPGELEKLYPAFIVIGGVLFAMTTVVAILAGVTSKSKYLGKAGGVMLAMTISLLAIVQMIKSFSKMDANTNYGAMMGGLVAIVAVLGMIALVLFAAGTMANGNLVESTKAGSILAVGAVMLAVAIMIKSVINSIDRASKIEKLETGLAIVASVLLALIVVFSIMTVLIDANKKAGSEMMKLAGSMAMLALAVGLMTPAILVLSQMPVAGVLGAAAAIGILVLALAGAITILSKVPGKKLLATAAVFGVIAVVLGVLMLAVSAFASTMTALVTQVPWETLTERVKAFHAVMAPELPLLLGLGAAVLMFGIGCGGAALAAGIFGASFFLISAGILMVAIALPKLTDGILYFMQQLQSHGREIVGFVALVIGAILAVMVARKMEFATTVVSIVEGIVAKLQDGVLIGKVLGVLGLFADKALAFLIAIAPLFSQKLVDLIVKLIWSVSEALNARSNQLIAAFESLIGTLFTIAIKAVTNLSGDMWGFLVSFLGELLAGVLESIPIPGADKWAEKLRGWAESGAGAFEGATRYISDAADRALERTFNSSEYKPDIEATATMTITDVESARYRPGDSANIIFDDTVPVNVGSDKVDLTVDSDVGAQAAEVVVGEFDQELSGNGESKGVTGVIEDTFGNLSESIPIDTLTSSFGGILSGPEMTDMFSASGETGLMSYVGAFTDSATGKDSTSMLESGAASTFNIFGNAFNATAEGEGGTSLLSHNTIVGLFNGLISKAKEILPEAGATVFDLFKGGYDERSKTASPSKVMAEEGYWAIVGLANGITKNAAIAESAGEATANGVIDEFRQTMEKVALIASDDFTISPTITPVVDMSRANAAAGAIGAMLGTSHTNYVNTISRRTDSISAATSVSPSARSAQVNSSVNDGFRSLSDRIDELGEKLTNMQIVLDTGVLVGSTSGRMDSQLGKIAARRERAR